MSQPKASRKTQEEPADRQRSSEFPELEFETASWVWHFWAQSVSNPSTDAERRNDLLKKAEPLQKAIGKAMGKGVTCLLPPEMVKDEFESVKDSIHFLHEEFERIRSSSETSQEEKITCGVHVLHNAKCRYTKDDQIVRPLLPNNASDERIFSKKFINLRFRLDTENMAQEFVQKLLGYDIKLVLKKEKREWPNTSGEQRFLVAMFVAGVRQKIPMSIAQQRLLLEALKESRYPAIGLYHLARFSSAFKHPIESFELDDEMLRRVTDTLRTQA